MNIAECPVFLFPSPGVQPACSCPFQLRLSMKSYSFVRENAYKVLYPWHKEDSSGSVWLLPPSVGGTPDSLCVLPRPCSVVQRADGSQSGLLPPVPLLPLRSNPPLQRPLPKVGKLSPCIVTTLSVLLISFSRKSGNWKHAIVYFLQVSKHSSA